MWLGQVKGETNTVAALDGLGSGIFPKWLKILLSYVADAFSCKALLFSVDTAQCPEGTEMTLGGKRLFASPLQFQGSVCFQEEAARARI